MEAAIIKRTLPSNVESVSEISRETGVRIATILLLEETGRTSL
jgi:hypothetical protein